MAFARFPIGSVLSKIPIEPGDLENEAYVADVLRLALVVASGWSDRQVISVDDIAQKVGLRFASRRTKDLVVAWSQRTGEPIWKYVVTATRNECRSSMNRERALELEQVEELIPRSDLDDADLRVDILNALDRLDPLVREYVRLAFLLGFTENEIAEHCWVTRGYADYQLEKAKRRLAYSLAEERSRLRGPLRVLTSGTIAIELLRVADFFSAVSFVPDAHEVPEREGVHFLLFGPSDFSTDWLSRKRQEVESRVRVILTRVAERSAR
jgi:DNA-directed RNA polymerase specialized sigma24 family protein